MSSHPWVASPKLRSQAVKILKIARARLKKRRCFDPVANAYVINLTAQEEAQNIERRIRIIESIGK